MYFNNIVHLPDAILFLSFESTNYVRLAIELLF